MPLVQEFLGAQIFEGFTGSRQMHSIQVHLTGVATALT